MSNTLKISPSILASDYANLQSELDRISTSDMIHIDVMDGHFVPNISIGPPVVASIRKCTDMFLDCHLMISEPLKYIDAFKKAGADMISFHLESDSDPDEVIEKIIQCGIKPAVVIKPQTAASAVFPYLKKVFAVLVMTVEPGFGGQSFMTDTVKKIKEIRDEAERLSIPLHIEVDGGIDKNTAPVAKEAGADMLVAGSYIFNSDDVVSAVASLR